MKKIWIVLLLVFFLAACATTESITPAVTGTLTPTLTPTVIVSPTSTITPTLGMTSSTTSQGFVIVQNGKFMLDGKPYTFVGTNFWQGMNLGVKAPSGDRAQLDAELDRLQQLGVTNLRVMAASEGPNSEPNRMVPALMTAPGVYDNSMLDGLDYLIAGMGKRNLRAVMILNNYWQWSGGMAQYVSWHEKSAIPYPGDWGVFMAYSAKFYACGECQMWYRNHISMIVNHINPYTGLKYRDDPTIFAWELANEPRRYPVAWINDTAAYIKSLDPNHMVTTGSEGTPPGERQDFIKTHHGPNIDYATIHIWPQNWGWYDPKTPSSYASAEAKARSYFEEHAAKTEALNKPLVLEEFGLARDWEPVHDIYDSKSTISYRDRFYMAMFDEVYKSMLGGGLAAGDNFWVWAGQSRPGDAWVGDPPHETPGWYSVYDTDASTLAIIAAHVVQMSAPKK